jgi:phage terminase large subunit
MDERTFRQEYEATFETFAGRIFYAFERANIRQFTVEHPEQILIGMDFNIDPMSAVIAVRLGDDLQIIDEIRMFSSNTQEMVAEIRQRYPKSKVTVYPDPASRQRKTSAGGQTDLSILQNAGFTVKAPYAHDAIRDSVNAVNSRFCDARGTRHVFVDPRCKYTIESLERHAYKPGTSQPDKDSGYDHMTDAVRYMISYIWPVRRDLPPVPQQRWSHRTQ